MTTAHFRPLQAAWFILLAILAVACGGGNIATIPIATATPQVGATAQSGIPVPQGGGVVQLPAAGGMANSLTFKPGNPVGLTLNVQTFSFGQTSVGTASASKARQPQDVSDVNFAICPDITAVAFAVSVDTPLAQLGSYEFSPLPLYIVGFQSGTFAVKIYDAPRAAYVLNHANWELSFHQDPSECDGVLMGELFPDTYDGVNDSELPAPMLVGTGSFSGGSIVSFPFTPAQVGATILHASDTYVLFASFAPGSAGTGSPNPIPTATATAAPSPSPSPTPAATSTPSPAPSATGSLTINPGSNNMFLGNPPAPLASLSPSLFYTGTIAGIVSPMNASYMEVAGASPNGCPITGAVVYSLEVTYPNTFAFATTGAGYMATIITPGSADGTSYHAELFRASGCASLAGPSIVTVSGGTLSFAGGGALTIGANETDIVEFWH